MDTKEDGDKKAGSHGVSAQRTAVDGRASTSGGPCRICELNVADDGSVQPPAAAIQSQTQTSIQVLPKASNQSKGNSRLETSRATMPTEEKEEEVEDVFDRKKYLQRTIQDVMDLIADIESDMED